MADKKAATTATKKPGFPAMSEAEKAAAVARYDRVIPLSETTALTRADRKRSDPAQADL